MSQCFLLLVWKNMAVITRWSCKRGGRKAGFHCKLVLTLHCTFWRFDISFDILTRETVFEEVGGFKKLLWEGLPRLSSRRFSLVCYFIASVVCSLVHTDREPGTGYQIVRWQNREGALYADVQAHCKYITRFYISSLFIQGYKQFVLCCRQTQLR